MTHAIGLKLEEFALRRIASDRLVIPALPALAMKLLEVVRDPDFSIRAASSLIEQDCVMVARVLRASNAAAFASGNVSIGSIEQAAMRLGASKLKTLIVEVAANQLFTSHNLTVDRACKTIWEHSRAVATVARDLAALTDADSESAFLAGLLHDIGKPIMAALLLESERALFGKGNTTWLESGEWIESVERTHRAVGIALVEKWDLPAAIQQAVRDCSDYDVNNRPCSANYVRFANALVKDKGIYVGTVDATDVSSLIMLGRSLLSVDDEVVSRVMKNLNVA